MSRARVSIQATHMTATVAATTIAAAASACPLCGGTNARPLSSAPSNFYVRCADCSHVFARCMPEAAASETNDEDARSPLRRDGVHTAMTTAAADARAERAGVPDDKRDDECDDERDDEYADDKYKAALLESWPERKRTGTVLEISFGALGFEFVRSDSGWLRLLDADKEDRMRGACMKQGEQEAQTACGTFAGLDALRQLDAEAFDLILLWDALARVSRPVEALASAARALRAEGRLIATVPNADGFGARVRHRRARRSVNESVDVSANVAPCRLQQFTPRTLGLAFCEAGLFPEEVRGIATLDAGRNATPLGALLERAGAWLGLPPALAAVGRRNQLFARARGGIETRRSSSMR